MLKKHFIILKKVAQTAFHRMISRGTSGKLYDTFSITIKSLIEFLNQKNNLTTKIILTMRIK